MCLVDASEMVDTYGAGLEEVRGFVHGGWGACLNAEGDLSGCGRLFRVSLSQFESDLLPHLTSHDCVLCIHGNTTETHLQSLMNRVLAGPAKCGLLVVAEDSQSEVSFHHLLNCSRYETTVFLSLPYYNAFGQESVFAGFGLKLVLNAVSTGANIMKGRVHGNTMINLTLSNDKLFYRATDIVQELSGASRQQATEALLKAIHRVDDVVKYQDEPVSTHITIATTQNMVVPLALLLAGGQSSSVAQAELLLTSTQSLNSLICSPETTPPTT
jgi:N-acetylmuramic acid 6-phosphate (MurNAc-6-P) etherase